MKMRFLVAVSMIALTVSGCTTTTVSPQPDVVKTAADAPLRADVNPGQNATVAEIPTKETASLADILAKGAKAPKIEEAKKGEDKLRLPAMQEAAIAYGAQAGLAFTTRAINKTLELRAPELAKTYDFQRVMIQGPNDVMVTPPIISKAQDAWEAADAGKTLRVADTVYQIEDQVRFSPVAPMWQSYLITDFKEAEMPPGLLLPKNDDEQEQWKKWVQEGWKRGEEQAEQTFGANLDRLNRDYTGMIRFKTLAEEGQVSLPKISEANLGTTGTGQDRRDNDRLIRITQDPSLTVNARQWSSSVTSTDADGKPVGAEKPAPAPVAAPAHPVEAPRHVRHRPAPAPKPVRPVVAKHVDEPTSGGTGRF